ncbi:MAG: tetratricopeptide repeat protein [Bacteroidales bacterium]|nr:tetratricopeptide repeat protein [Bacteroidales bacterium]
MRRYVIVILAAVLFASCGGKRTEQQAVRQEADSLVAAYRYSDSLFAACGRIDTAAFNDFITRAQAFAETHPQDTLAPDMLYRAGVGSMILAKAAHTTDDRAANARRALAIFRQFQEQFPDHPQYRLCYWQRAIVYDDVLGDWRSAESEYRDFINRYPDDPLTPQFQEYLIILGKSESELETMLHHAQ